MVTLVEEEEVKEEVADIIISEDVVLIRTLLDLVETKRITRRGWILIEINIQENVDVGAEKDGMISLILNIPHVINMVIILVNAET